MRSLDARTKCGCIFVKDNVIVSEGYNGPLRGIDDTKVPNLEYHDQSIYSKNFIHAEVNGIINAAKYGRQLDGCTAYITGMPCIDCYSKMYQSGISKIIIPNNANKPSVCSTKEYKEHLDYLMYLTNYQLKIFEVECNINITMKNSS